MTRELDFRYRILKHGASFGWLSEANSGRSSIRTKCSSSLKSRLTGQYLLPDGENLLDAEIQPEMILDGTVYPLGVYVPATVEEVRTGTGTAYSVTAYDRCWLLQTRTLEAQTTFMAGANYLDPVKSLLGQAGITLIAETPTAATLTETRADWPIGTDFLTVINSLLSEINYGEIWFNASGAAVLAPKKTPTAENIDHRLDSRTVRSLILPGLTRKTDIFSTPNVFLVVCSNPDKSGVLTAESENNNPQSPMSIQRRGRRILSVQTVNNIASQAALQAYADQLRDNSLFTSETFQVTTALFPGWGVNDITSLQYDDIRAICTETAWTMNLNVGGNMTHTLERMVLAIG